MKGHVLYGLCNIILLCNYVFLPKHILMWDSTCLNIQCILYSYAHFKTVYFTHQHGKNNVLSTAFGYVIATVELTAANGLLYGHTITKN